MADTLDEEWWGLADFSALPEDTVEVDDQHVAFLEGEHQKEEDEVECLVTMLEVASEQWLVP